MRIDVENYIKMAEHAMSNLGTFESLGYERNGKIYWRATVFMQKLGYTDLKSFQGAINRAIKACMSLNIEFSEHIIHLNELEKDFELTRFACYLISMNADVKKPQVAQAQMYFIQQTRQLELLIENAAEELDRFAIRDELKEGTKELQKAAKSKGVTRFDIFNNQGYIGLYNMTLTSLKKRKGIGQKDIISDFMGRTELAANLFRVTQTEEKIKNDPAINSQRTAENAHLAIAKKVRDMVVSNTHILPENLPTAKNINASKKEFKKIGKTMDGIDKPTKKSKK